MRVMSERASRVARRPERAPAWSGPAACVCVEMLARAARSLAHTTPATHLPAPPTCRAGAGQWSAGPNDRRGSGHRTLGQLAKAAASTEQSGQQPGVGGRGGQRRSKRCAARWLATARGRRRATPRGQALRPLAGWRRPRGVYYGACVLADERQWAVQWAVRMQPRRLASWRGRMQEEELAAASAAAATHTSQQ